MFKPISKILVLTLIFFTINSFANATSNASNQVKTNEVKEINIKEINKQIISIEKNILNKNKNKKSQDITKFIKDLDLIQKQLSEIKTDIEQNLSFTQKRIEAIGNEPVNGAKEPYELAKKRKDFRIEETSLKAKIAETDIMLAKIEELNIQILNFRNKELLNNIFNRQDPLIYPSNFFSQNMKFAEFFFEVIKSPITWYKNLIQTEKNFVNANLIYVVLIIVILSVIAIYTSFLIKKYFGYKKNLDTPSYNTKFFAAMSTLIAKGIIPSTIISVFIFWVKHVKILNTEIFGNILIKGGYFLLFVFIAKAIVDVIFVPKASQWRLIKFSDLKAKAISSAFSFSIIIISTFLFLETIAINGKYSNEAILYTKTILCIIKSFCIILLTRKIFYEEDVLVQNIEKTKTDEDDIGELTLFSKIKLIIYLFILITFSISLFGYVNLSDFILDRSIFTILIIGLAYIIGQTLNGLFHYILTMNFWRKKLKIGRKTLAKVDAFFQIILNPILVLLTIFTLLILWGVSEDLLLKNIKKLFTGFYIGEIKISLTSILLAIITFVLLMIFFKFIKNQLIRGKLLKIEIDYSVRSSLASGINFFGFIVSVLFAIIVAGGSLGSLTIAAGALSFGVGLGLQNIVNNYVSGLIILFERPIRVGDSVTINGQDGVVKQINIRSTELETSTKATIIIPNANILSNTLINMTHNGRTCRVDIKVNTTYKSNPNEVINLLLNIAKNNQKIMSKPTADVAFNELSNGIFEFTLYFYISNISNKQNISNEIRIEILKKFKENNIELAVTERLISFKNKDNIDIAST